MNDTEKQAWQAHNEGMQHYYKRDFDQAITCFAEVERLLPEDAVAPMLKDRCLRYKKTPPPETWDGVEIMKSK